MRSAGLKWQGRVHETIPLLPECRYCDIAITHRKAHPTPSDRNLRIYERMRVENVPFDARMHFYYARELLANGRFAQARETFERFLQRSDAFLENRIKACLDLVECAEKPGENPLPPLLRSLEYDVPRAEACCEIGNRFLLQNQVQPAIFWYKTALQAPKKTKNGGFIRPDAYDYVPCPQLCVAYYRIGDIARSIEFNERAAQTKPTDASVVQNRAFFESLKKRELSE